jgi:hypothetical protein
MKAAVELPGWGTQLTVQDMMMAALRLAKAGLRRKSIDELEELFEWCRRISRENWPPPVAGFVDRFNRPRGRMRSNQADMRRFHSDPNRIAAHLASLYIAEWRHRPGRSKRMGPYKINAENGSKVTIHKEAVRRAIDKVKSSSLRLARPPRHVLRVDVVESLVRRGRTKRPTS